MVMRAADFLFPTDLRVTDTGIQNVLVLGSCAAGGFVAGIRRLAPNVRFDVINVGAALPDEPPLPMGEYDFQFIQLPLRDIITDKVIYFKNYLSPDTRSAILENALNSLKFRLDSALRYNRDSNALTFVSNFPVPQVPVVASLDRISGDQDVCTLVRRLNEHIAELVNTYTNVFVFDYETIANSLGKRFFQDDVMAFYSHFFYLEPTHRDWDVHPSFNAPAGGRLDPLPQIEDVYPSQVDQMHEAIWRQWENLYRIIHQMDAVKLVIFDLDDTIWRGQIAEHYGNEGQWPVFHGWPLGIWEAINHLRARGILTAICSKNDAGLVEARWDRAVTSRWISPEHFTFREINWNPKAENIAKIIKQASLTPRSVLFVDDNPVERESVAAALPGIRVIGSNPYVVRRILLWSSETQVARLSAESVNRDAMMRKQQLRETERASMSREEFLLGLNCSIRLSRLSSTSSPDFPRSLELLNKTNQFNTTGERWSEAQITGFFAEGGCFYVFSVEDKFTQYGLVGVILYRSGQFRQFAMSCRILGLDIEASVISEIIRREEAHRPGVDFAAVVWETEANMVCRDVYVRCGFVHDQSDPTLFVRPRSPTSQIAPHLCLEFAEA
jgi:FkbH-like protein